MMKANGTFFEILVLFLSSRSRTELIFSLLEYENIFKRWKQILGYTRIRTFDPKHSSQKRCWYRNYTWSILSTLFWVKRNRSYLNSTLGPLNKQKSKNKRKQEWKLSRDSKSRQVSIIQKLKEMHHIRSYRISVNLLKSF